MPDNGNRIQIKPGMTFVQIPEKDLSRFMAAVHDLQTKRMLKASDGGVSGTKCKTTKDNTDFNCGDSD